MAEALDPRHWVVVGPLAVRHDGGHVRLNGRNLDLTTAQALVLVALIRRGGRLARREDIYQDAFGRLLPSRSRAVDQHVGRIRAALGPHARYIITVGRVGYRIDLEALGNGPVTQALPDNGT